MSSHASTLFCLNCRLTCKRCRVRQGLPPTPCFPRSESSLFRWVDWFGPAHLCTLHRKRLTAISREGSSEYPWHCRQVGALRQIDHASAGTRGCSLVHHTMSFSPGQHIQSVVFRNIVARYSAHLAVLDNTLSIRCRQFENIRVTRDSSRRLNSKGKHFRWSLYAAGQCDLNSSWAGREA